MPMFILMTAEQAAVVRGASTSVPSSALNPTERQGSLCILSTDVLNDPAHERHREHLSALPIIDSNDFDFPLPLEEVT